MQTSKLELPPWFDEVAKSHDPSANQRWYRWCETNIWNAIGLTYGVVNLRGKGEFLCDACGFGKRNKLQGDIHDVIAHINSLEHQQAVALQRLAE